MTKKRYNACAALMHYLHQYPDNTPNVHIVCGFAMTSEAEDKWNPQTKYLYVDHTDAELEAWLDHFDYAYDPIKDTVAVVINLMLSNDRVLRFDASLYYEPSNRWHEPDTSDLYDMKEVYKDKATHYALEGWR